VKPISAKEQAALARHCEVVRAALSVLQLAQSAGREVVVATAQLEKWLDKNEGRWAK
jgi:hypothetical protein